MITWEQLTGLQRETLKDIELKKYVDMMPNTLHALKDMGLIEAVASYFGVERGYDNHRFTLTDAGSDVLAQAEAEKPEEKTMDSNIKSVISDLEAIATNMTGDLTPANVANIALNKLTQQPEAEGEDDDIDMRTMSDDDLQRTIDQLPAIRAQYAMEEELATLRAQLAASLEREAALKAALFEVHKLLRVLPIRSNYTAEQHEIVGRAYDIALAASDGGEGGAE